MPKNVTKRFAGGLPPSVTKKRKAIHRTSRNITKLMNSFKDSKYIADFERRKGVYAPKTSNSYDIEQWALKKRKIHTLRPFHANSVKRAIPVFDDDDNYKDDHDDDDKDDAISSDERSGESLVTIPTLNQQNTSYCTCFAYVRVCVRMISFVCPELLTSSKIYKYDCKAYSDTLYEARDIFSLFNIDDNKCRGGEFRYMLLHAYLLYVAIVNYETLTSRMTNGDDQGHHTFQLLWDHIHIDRTYARRLGKYTPIELTSKAKKEKLDAVFAILDIFNFKLDVFAFRNFDKKKEKKTTHSKKKKKAEAAAASSGNGNNKIAIVPFFFKGKGLSAQGRNEFHEIWLLWNKLQYSSRRLYMGICLHGQILNHLVYLNTPDLTLQELLDEEIPTEVDEMLAHEMVLESITSEYFKLKNSWTKPSEVIIPHDIANHFSMASVCNIVFFYANDDFLKMQGAIYKTTKQAVDLSDYPKSIKSCYRNDTFQTDLQASRVKERCGENDFKQFILDSNFLHNFEVQTISSTKESNHSFTTSVLTEAMLDSVFETEKSDNKTNPILGDRSSLPDDFGEDEGVVSALSDLSEIATPRFDDDDMSLFPA